jgi:hypothetical protein
VAGSGSTIGTPRLQTLRRRPLGLARRTPLLDETEAILRFLADELGPGTSVNVMAQYYPAGRIG